MQQSAIAIMNKQRTYLGEGTGEVITVFAHEMIAVTTKLLSKVCDDCLYFIFCEVCISHKNTFPGYKAGRAKSLNILIPLPPLQNAGKEYQ